MNPKDIVYKMVVLGRRLTTHFILDIFWGSSFMFTLDARATHLEVLTRLKEIMLLIGLGDQPC